MSPMSSSSSSQASPCGASNPSFSSAASAASARFRVPAGFHASLDDELDDDPGADLAARALDAMSLDAAPAAACRLRRPRRHRRPPPLRLPVARRRCSCSAA